MMDPTLSRTSGTHKQLRILFVDDEEHLQEFMRSELPQLGHDVMVCGNGRAALKILEKQTFDAAILDLRMPGMNGIELLQQMKAIAPDIEAVVQTGYASQETAIEALRLGAFDYITKPCKLAEIEAILERIAERRELLNKTLALQTRVEAAEGPSILIGQSPAMQAVHRLIATVAPTDSTVLIQGETGTGKELVARTIFQQSKRAEMPFVPVNCAALSESLVESELFGHGKHAFTGAGDREKKGLFEVSNGGTLFLDELGELNKNIQVKLLRFLESGEIRRVSETQPFRVDVRILCATNRDLRDMVREDVFREDLFFRVNTFEIRLPPLRERRSDIPELARHLLARAARRPMDQVAGLLSASAIDMLVNCDWPGNVRELANALEYAYIISGGQTIMSEHFPAHMLASHVTPATIPLSAAIASAPPNAAAIPAHGSLYGVEMAHILRVLDKHNGHKASAANELGISLKTLYNKLNKYEEERRAAAG
ncbi:MAG TPA: sigma-54 dependent transcriptional regulator [Gemmataceae bacterium]|nr:sigma-54 dependent transcriptional regulator [Gemmataceae bacterium]